MINDSRPVGIFDSGVGGLTVARQIMAALPRKQLVYFGDSLRAPYGSRQPTELTRFSREIIDFLHAKDIGALVVACGTISATVFDAVRQMTNVPVVGMLDAAVDAALDATKSGRIGLIATAGTITSGAHKKAIVRKQPYAELVAIACPLFVPLAEEGWLDNDVARLTAKMYLAQLAQSNIDTLILGCTHYPLLVDSIKAALPADINIIDPAVRLAKNLADIVDSSGEENPPHEFFVSGNKEKFDQMSHIALGRSYDAKEVRL